MPLALLFDSTDWPAPEAVSVLRRFKCYFDQAIRSHPTRLTAYRDSTIMHVDGTFAHFC